MAAPVVLYGATGYTGRLVAAELRRRGVDAVLAGRDATRLAALRAELGVDWPLRAAPVDDLAALRGALAGAGVVLNCAGPFTHLGAPVIEAALATGAHYVDTTGEQVYLQRVFEHVDAPARARGVAVVPAAGFDYLPGDLLAAVTARGRQPLAELEIAYAIEGFGMSRGTLRSGIEIASGQDVVYADGTWRAARRLPERGRFTFPAPIGEQPVVRFPGGEVLTVPRHVRTGRVVERITTSTFVPAPALAPAVPLMTAALGALTRVPAVGASLGALVGRLPEGPEETARRATAYTVVCEARGEDGAVIRGVLRGRDVYATTAAIVVEAALRVGADGFEGAGVLAPAQAFAAEDFLGVLRGHGVSVDAPGG